MRNAAIIDPNKVAIYIRWSTDDQGDGTTLDVQLEGCKAFLKSQGWHVNERLIYVDDGYSGGSLDRPAMTKLRQAVENGDVDCVVVLKLDRLSRSVIDTVTLVLDEWEGTCYIRSAREPIDTTTPMGKQFFYMLVSYAEWERNVIRDRMYSGKLKRAQQGRNPGFKTPYGYSVGDTPGTFVVQPEEAEIIKRIFHEYTHGKGANAIAAMFNHEGLPFRKSKVDSKGTWKGGTIKRMLANEAYLGHLVWGRQMRNPKWKKGNKQPFWIKNDQPTVYLKDNQTVIPAIITPEQFERAQRCAEQRNVAKSGVSGRAASSPHLLTGITKCRFCGHSISGKGQSKPSANKVENFFYYQCKGKKDKGHAFCPSGYIRQDILDNEIMRRVKELFLTDAGKEELRLVLNEQYGHQEQRLVSAVEQTEQRIKELEAEIERLDLDYRSKEISGRTYERLMTTTEKELDEAEANLSEFRTDLEEMRRNMVNLDEVDEAAAAFAEWDNLPVVEKKNLLRQWIDKIVVAKHRDEQVLDIEITYRWNKADALTAPHEPAAWNLAAKMGITQEAVS